MVNMAPVFISPVVCFQIDGSVFIFLKNMAVTLVTRKAVANEKRIIIILDNAKFNQSINENG